MDPTTHAILSAIGTLVAARVVAAVRRARLRRAYLTRRVG